MIYSESLVFTFSSQISKWLTKNSTFTLDNDGNILNLLNYSLYFNGFPQSVLLVIKFNAISFKIYYK